MSNNISISKVFANILSLSANNTYNMADFKAFRKENKLSQIEAANYFNCTQGFISQIEKGTRPIPATFIEKAQKDISINANNLINDTNSIEEDLYETVPAYFVKMIFEERRMHDQKELELISQNQELINIIKDELSTIKRGYVLKGENVICAAASGLDLEK